MEALADAGGICISNTVYDAIQGKLDFGFEFLGEQLVKNIDRPINVYRVRAERPVVRPARSRKSWNAAVAADRPVKRTERDKSRRAPPTPA